jgi:hypothetical protein
MNVSRFLPVVPPRPPIASAPAVCLALCLAASVASRGAAADPAPAQAADPADRAPSAPRRSHIQPVGEVAVATRNADTLGLRLARASEVLRQQLALARGAGLVVEEVVAGSPAEQAGFKQHDVLVLLDDQMLLLPEQLAALLEANGTDAAPECTLLRGGTRVTLSLGRPGAAKEPTLAKGPAPAAKPALPAPSPAERTVPSAVRTAAKPSAGAGLRPAASALAIVEPRGTPTATSAGTAVKSAKPFRPTPAAPVPTTSPTTSPTMSPTMSRGQAAAEETLLRQDPDYQIKLSRGEQTRLVVIDARGRILFNDQIDTQDSRGLVPAAVRQRVEEMERALESKVSPPAFEVGRLETAPVEVR